MVIASLDPSSAELSASNCRVCRLLSYIKTPPYDGHHCALYAYSGLWGYTQLRVISEELHGLSKRKLDSLSYDEEFPSLTVIGPGDYRDLTGMKTQSDRFDPIHYDALTSIMRDCLRNHKKTCKTLSLGGLLIFLVCRLLIQNPERLLKPRLNANTLPYHMSGAE